MHFSHCAAELGHVSVFFSSAACRAFSFIRVISKYVLRISVQLAKHGGLIGASVKHMLYASSIINFSVKIWPVNGQLPTQTRAGSANNIASRLLHELDKLFPSDCDLSFPLCQHTQPSCRGCAAQAHTSAVPACLHGVSLVLTSWESSLVFAGLLHSAPKWHKGPFMAESASIHGHWVIAGRIHNCSASSISEAHGWKWRHRRLF